MSKAATRIQPTVLITGASRGIGAAVAERCLRADVRVVRVARSPMQPLTGAIDLNADLTDARIRGLLLDRVEEEIGCPDWIVSAAGGFLVAPIEASSDPVLREQLALNLEAPFAIARRFLPLMRQRGNGVHLLIGSVADHRGFPGNAAYAASKYGLRGLHETLLAEYTGSGVHCSLISPGPVDTSIWDPIDPDHREGFMKRSDMLPPSELAEAVWWVLSRPPKVRINWLQIGSE